LSLWGLSCGKTHAPNGPKGVLFFEPQFKRVGQGLSFTMEIPRQRGPSPSDVDDLTTYTFDFDGTDIAAKATDGLIVLGTSLDAAQGWQIRLACDSAPEVPAGLSVTISAAGKIRYADSTTVVCQAGKLSLGSINFSHYAIGAVAGSVNVALDDQTGPLDGFGLAMSNPGAAVEVVTLSGAGIGAPLPSANERVNSSVWFHALRAGPAETLTAGSAHVALPFDVVTDAEWSLSVAASPLPDASLLEVKGTAALLNGGPVGVAGVPCRLTGSLDSPWPAAESSCTFDIPNQPGRVCMALGTNEGCVDIAAR
jgi:hypothetical protein